MSFDSFEHLGLKHFIIEAIKRYVIGDVGEVFEVMLELGYIEKTTEIVKISSFHKDVDKVHETV